jgi:hypothetical protein
VIFLGEVRYLQRRRGVQRRHVAPSHRTALCAREGRRRGGRTPASRCSTHPPRPLRSDTHRCSYRSSKRRRRHTAHHRRRRRRPTRQRSAPPAPPSILLSSLAPRTRCTTYHAGVRAPPVAYSTAERTTTNTAPAAQRGQPCCRSRPRSQRGSCCPDGSSTHQNSTTARSNAQGISLTECHRCHHCHQRRQYLRHPTPYRRHGSGAVHTPHTAPRHLRFLRGGRKEIYT